MRSALSLVLNLVNGKLDKTYPFRRNKASFALSEEIQRLLSFTILVDAHRRAKDGLKQIDLYDRAYNRMFTRVGSTPNTRPVLRTREAISWCNSLKDFWKGCVMSTTGPGVSHFVFMGNSDYEPTHLTSVLQTLENMINLEKVFHNTSLSDALRLYE